MKATKISYAAGSGLQHEPCTPSCSPKLNRRSIRRRGCDLGALSSGERWVRALAAYGLSLLFVASACVAVSTAEANGTASPVKKCIAVLSSPTAPHTEKWEAVQELRRAGDEAVPGLLEVLAATDTNNSRYYAIRALGYLGSPEATEALSQVLLDRGYTPRRYAAMALGQIADPRAVPALKKALTDVSHVRADALDALVKIDSEESRQALEDYHFAHSDPGLKVEISCKPGPYAVGDSIEIEAKLVNVARKTVPIVVSNGEPISYLVFQRTDGSFVESVDTEVLEDRPIGVLLLHDLKPGAALKWRLTGLVAEWTRGEKDDHTFIPTDRSFLTLDFGSTAYHIRRPGEFRVRVVLRQDEDLVERLKHLPAFAARSADIGPKKVASNAALFSVRASGRPRR